MIFLKTEDEIELLRQSNLLVGRTLAEVAKLVKPGVTTKELDKVAEEFIRDHGAVPTFKGRNSTMISDKLFRYLIQLFSGNSRFHKLGNFSQRSTNK